MQICKIVPEKLRPALELIWEVFEEFEVPTEEDKSTSISQKHGFFLHFIEYHNMVEKVNQGEMKFYGCYLNQYLIGVIALRTGQHISLLFVRGKFHHLGVATKLMKVVENEVLAQNPKIRAVTVNASPYAVGFYEKNGFVPLDKEQKADGIRFTPMRKMI